MAFTVSHLAKTVFGNMRIHCMRVTADGAEGEVLSADTALSYIDTVASCPQSASTGANGTIKLAINEDSSGVASNGCIGISGVTSGDEYLITAFGR